MFPFVVIAATTMTRAMARAGRKRGKADPGVITNPKRQRGRQGTTGLALKRHGGKIDAIPGLFV
jgi:hypothetical protein